MLLKPGVEIQAIQVFHHIVDCVVFRKEVVDPYDAPILLELQKERGLLGKALGDLGKVRLLPPQHRYGFPVALPAHILLGKELLDGHGQFLL